MIVSVFFSSFFHLPHLSQFFLSMGACFGSSRRDVASMTAMVVPTNGSTGKTRESTRAQHAPKPSKLKESRYAWNGSF